MKALFLSILLGAALPSFGAELNLSWDANPVDQQATYKVYRKDATANVLVGETTNTTFKLTGLTPGKYIYFITANNMWNVESLPSNEVSTPAAPSKPVNLKLIPVNVN